MAYVRQEMSWVLTLLLVCASTAAQASKFDSYREFLGACRLGDSESVAKYLIAGASVTVTDENGFTPLFIAAAYGHLPVVKLLVAYGASVTASDRNNDTTLKYAAFYGHKDLVTYFISCGVPLNQQDVPSGRTALLDAIIGRHEACAQELIRHGADLVIADKQGITPLMAAAGNGMTTVVKTLLKMKVPINAHDAAELTALSYAYENAHEEIIQLLEDHGATAPVTTPASMRRHLKKLPMNEATRTAIMQKIAQCEQLKDSHAEKENLRHVLVAIFNLPWGKITPLTNSFKTAQTILHADHAHMETVKNEILDFIALHMTKPQQHPPIICLVGPAGVGKTSLCASLAKALNRNFERVALGGVSEASALRGHERVYLGSEPGLFTKALTRAGSMNPVILVDEIDKMGHSAHHGDPYAALLELFDPQQNSAFRDENLEIPLDFSQVIFVATANSLDSIPHPLLDRMKIIYLSSYSPAEKITIIEKHLLTKITTECGVKTQDLQLSAKLLAHIIKHYTHEAGVRHIARILTTLCAKVARAKLEGKTYALNQDSLIKLLGPAHPVAQKNSEHKARIGTVTGLAWTSLGGDTLSIETVIMPGKGELILTGCLGDVMQESAKVAISYARVHAQELGIDPTLFTTRDIHIHVPEGATPKDGPSAGVTIATAIVSSLTKRPVSGTLAMTGELTLQGSVEPIGGLKEKLVAAKRDGFTRICAPYANRYDLALEPEVTEGLTITWVTTLDEVIKIALAS